jgi:hypothetical protein
MIRVDDVVADLQQAKNLRILVLDACRDNPLADELKRSLGATRAMSLQRGLAKIDTPSGMIVAYATQAGRTADDGTGRNSPYTAAFLRHIEAQEEIGTVFRRISADVYAATRQNQLPELSLSLIGEFFLRGKLETSMAPPVAPPPDPCAAAGDHWRSAEAIGTIAAFEDHVNRFPRCAFAGLAKAGIDHLKNRIAAVAPPVVPLQAEPPKQASPPSVASAPPTPSFDCATHHGADEIAICRSGRLAELDRQLDALYLSVRKRLSQGKQLELRDQQRAWLKQRTVCGGQEACLSAVYESRIAALRAWR